MERGHCAGIVPVATMTPLSEMDRPVPLRSDQAPYDGYAVYSRGVRWADSDLPGQRTLLVYGDRGILIKEERIAEQYADEKSEQAAWAWLNDHCPPQPQVERARRDEERREPVEYLRLRLI